MPVNPVSSNTAEPYIRDTSKDTRETNLSTDTFLKLLVAQLKYQDPLEPQKDTAFVTQMAQMTTLQEMQQMNATLQNSQAYDMVGKQIYAEVYDKDTHETRAFAGLVDSVVIMSGIPYVVVGNQAINIADVRQVFPAPVADSTSDTTDTTTNGPETVSDTPPDTTTGSTPETVPETVPETPPATTASADTTV